MKACIIFDPNCSLDRLQRIQMAVPYLWNLIEELVLTEEYATLLNLKKGLNIKLYKKEETVISNCDIIISMGGDGTVLYAVGACHQAGVALKPILAINVGTIGFICPYSLNDLFTSKIDLAQKQMRTLLDAGDFSQGGPALNEIHVRKPSCGSRKSNVLSLEVSLNKQKICSFRGDGLLLATATGSTGYSFSAGGPIITPSIETDVIVLTPVNAIDASLKPIVLNLKPLDLITVSSLSEQTLEAEPDCSGRSSNTVLSKNYKQFGIYREKLPLFVPENFNYFSLLEKKLGWGRLSH